MESKLITLRIPPEVLARIDAEAKRLGVTRTALLLRPFSGGDPVATSPPPPLSPKRGATVVVRQPKRKALTTVRKPRGFDPVTNEPIYG